MEKTMKKFFLLLAAAIFTFTIGQSAMAENLVIKHNQGETAIPAKVERLVIMDYGPLDTIDALMTQGLISQDLAIAMPKANMPAYLAKYMDDKYVDLGTLKDFNLETVASFKPDLIIISLRQQDFYKQLSGIAPTIVINNIPNPYWEGVTQNIRDLGNIFGTQDAVEQALARLDTRAEQIAAAARAKNVKALILLTNDGKISAYGSGSRFGIIHDKLGVGQADDKIKVGIHGQLVNYEYIAGMNPDYIFVIDRSVAVGMKANDVRMLQNELIDGTNAAKNGRIIALDPQIWYLSGGGLESLDIMMDEVETALQK